MKKVIVLRKNYYFICIIIFVLISAYGLIISAGNWLIVNDELKKADAIVVLMGSPGDRILEANDVYSASLSNKIIFAEDNDPSRKDLKSRGIILPNNADVSRRIAIQLGIPDSVIIILPGYANSTIDEAKILREYIDKNNIKSIILVTSSSHIRRASMIFNNELSKCKNEIEIICNPSKYSNFDGENWWRERESRKKVVLEYLKLIQFLLFD